MSAHKQIDAVAFVSGVKPGIARAVLLGEETDDQGKPVGDAAKRLVGEGLDLLCTWHAWPQTTAIKPSKAGVA